MHWAHNLSRYTTQSGTAIGRGGRRRDHSASKIGRRYICDRVKIMIMMGELSKAKISSLEILLGVFVFGRDWNS